MDRDLFRAVIYGWVLDRLWGRIEAFDRSAMVSVAMQKMGGELLNPHRYFRGMDTKGSSYSSDGNKRARLGVLLGLRPMR